MMPSLLSFSPEPYEVSAGHFCESSYDRCPLCEDEYYWCGAAAMAGVIGMGQAIHDREEDRRKTRAAMTMAWLATIWNACQEFLDMLVLLDRRNPRDWLAKKATDEAAKPGETLTSSR